MMQKDVADSIGLLKIDCLGLTCLSILEEAAKLIKMPKDFYYMMEMDDEETFKVFREGRLNGIFQKARFIQEISYSMGVYPTAPHTRA